MGLNKYLKQCDNINSGTKSESFLNIKFWYNIKKVGWLQVKAN